MDGDLLDLSDGERARFVDVIFDAIRKDEDQHRCVWCRRSLAKPPFTLQVRIESLDHVVVAIQGASLDPSVSVYWGQDRKLICNPCAKMHLPRILEPPKDS